MRIGNNVSRAERFYTKLTPEMIKGLRTKYLLGLGYNPNVWWNKNLREFYLTLPTYLTKPGKKPERVQLDSDPNMSAYCSDVDYSKPFKNGQLVEWRISVWS